MTKALALAVTAGMLGAGCGAGAPPRPTVSVVVRGNPDVAPAVRELEQDPEFPTQVTVVDVPAAPPPEDDDTAIPTGIAEARRRYTEGDLETCERTLGNEERLVELVRHGRRGMAARVLFWRTACRVAAGDAAGADALADDLASLGLEIPPDADAASVEVEARLQAAFERLAHARRLRLALATAPPGAAVELDGRRTTCRTPCSLELAPGLHVIELRKPGHVPFVRTVRVEEDSEIELVQLVEADPELAARQWHERTSVASSADDPISMRLLSTAVRAPRLVLLEASPAEGTVAELRAAVAVDGSLRARARRTTGAGESLAEQVRGIIRDALVRGRVFEPASLFEEPWFWASVTGAAALAGAAVFWIMYEPPVVVRARF